MAGREKEDTRGWSVVMKMIDPPPAEPTAAEPTEHAPPEDAPRAPGALDHPTEAMPAVDRRATSGRSESGTPRSAWRASADGAERRRDAERTVIDNRMASVLARRPAVVAVEEFDQSIDTDGRLVAPQLLAEPSLPAPLAFPDRTLPDRVEKTELAALPQVRSFSEPMLPVSGEDTLEDRGLRLSPADRASSVSPRPRVAVGPGVGSPETKPAPRAPEPRAPKLVPPEPKRGAGEVRVTAATPSMIAGGPNVRITPSAASPAAPEHEPGSPKVADRRARSLEPMVPVEPIEKLRESEMTLLDLAAQIGLAPEPQRAKAEEPEPRSETRGGLAPSGPRPEAAVRVPLPEPGAKVAELLEAEAQDQAIRALQAPARLGEPSLHHLPTWLRATEGAAKIIPVLIATFVAFATVAVVVTLFAGRGSGASEHVTLKFLPIERPDGTLTADPNLPAPMVTLDTEPAGVLVVLDRKILGPTPLSFELPMRADKVGVELTGPYYETWIGQLVREPTGEMHAHVKLTRRR